MDIKRALYHWLFDFSEELRWPEKAVNCMAVFFFNSYWMIFISMILSKAGVGTDQLIEALRSNLVSGFFQIKEPGAISLIFFGCILTPIWEEFTFRVFPLNLYRTAFIARNQIMFLWHFSLISSIIFGFLHGSLINLLFQGVGGFSLCWLYLKNGRSYWSIVILHAIWNFHIYF